MAGRLELSDDVVEFLTAGTRTGMLGYVAADGRPLVAPVWFVVDDGQLVFNTGRETSKGRALSRDPRVVSRSSADSISPTDPAGNQPGSGAARASGSGSGAARASGPGSGPTAGFASPAGSGSWPARYSASPPIVG